MSVESCILCHKSYLFDRWIGDLHALFCDACGCLYIDPATPCAAAVSTTVPPVVVVPPPQRRRPQVVSGSGGT